MKNFIFIAAAILISRVALAQTCEADMEANVIALANGCAQSDCTPGGGTYGVMVYQSLPMLSPTDPYVNIICERHYCIGNEFAMSSSYAVRSCGGTSPTVEKIIKEFFKTKNMCGSIIQAENRVLGETIPLVGTSFGLNYFSSWATGRVADYTLSIPLSGATPRDNIVSFGIEVRYSGSLVASATYTNNAPNLNFSYVWDGLDSSLNPTLGSKKFQVKVTENRPSISIPIPSEIDLGSFKSKAIGIGGWVPSVFSYYDIGASKLYKGDGSVRAVVAKVIPTGYMIAEEDASLVYIFDSLGRIKDITTGLLGTSIYSFMYDSQNRLLSIVEPFSRTTYFNRDGSGVLTSITAPRGQITSVNFDSDDYLHSVTSPQGESYSMTYWGSGGLLKTFIKPEGQVSTFTYDSLGGLIKDEKSSGFFFEMLTNFNRGYSGDVTKQTRMGRATTVQTNETPETTVNLTTYPDSTQDNYSSTKYGSMSSTTSVSKGVTTTEYFQDDLRFGAMSRFATQVTINNGGAYYYYANTQNVTLSDPTDPFSITAYSLNTVKDNVNVTTTFNPTTKTFSAATSVGKTSTTIIDSYERVTSQKQGNLYPVEFTYTDDKITKIKQNTRETNLAYNATTGYLSTITNPLSQATGFTYDSAGRVTSKILPDLRTVTYSYDANGNITGITPPGRTVHTFNLNADENPSSYAPPTLSGVTTVNTGYTYNNDKQLTQISRPTGDSIQFSYDATTGVLNTVTTASNTYTYTMSGTNGLPSQITSATGPVTTINYAGTMPVQYTTYTNGWSQISDFTSNLSSNGTIGSDVVTTPSANSTINYLYDNDEYLSKAGDMTLTYNTPNGQLTGTALGTGTTGMSDTYTYNSFGEVSGYTAKRGTTTLYTLTLGRDGSGRINSKTEFMNSATNVYDYTFDSAGRLTQTNKNSSTVATYGYDSNSNRNSGTIGAQTTTATYDAQDRLNAYNTLTFAYNANGELTSKTNTTTSTTTSYVYDAFGNLVQVTIPGGTVITYEIDALNRRIGKKANGVLQKRWVYMDQTRIAAEISATGAISKRFIYGSKGNVPDYMLVGTTKYRIISDHLGSPRLVIKQSDGSVAQRMNHDEFGRVTEDTNPGYLPFGFAGGLYDNQTSIVRFGARDYDPEIGRWLSKDPIGFDGGDTNLFGYVALDPINWNDPSGLKTTIYISGGKYGHASVVVSTDGQTSWYDPGGSTSPRGGNGIIEPNRWGRYPFLNYIKEHGGSGNVSVYEFDTTAEEEQQILNNINARGDTKPGTCANSVSSVLNGVGRFKNLGTYWLPNRLGGALSAIPFK